MQSRKKQQWIGVSIENQLENQFPNTCNHLRDGSFNFEIIRYPVPLKGEDESTELLYTINWLDQIEDIADEIKNLPRDSMSSEVLKKYENTDEYIKYITGIITVYPDSTLQYNADKDLYSL